MLQSKRNANLEPKDISPKRIYDPLGLPPVKQDRENDNKYWREVVCG